jgi:hypothetical protein
MRRTTSWRRLSSARSADGAPRMIRSAGRWTHRGAGRPPRGRPAGAAPPPGAAQSELRIGHVAEPREHARLPRAARAEHDPRRAVRQPDQHEPARGQGLHLRRRTAFDFRRGPGPFVLQASVQTEATVDAVLEVAAELRAIRGERPVTRAGARDRTRGADARLPAQLRDRRADQPIGGAESRCTICRTTTSRRSSRRSWRSPRTT